MKNFSIIKLISLFLIFAMLISAAACAESGTVDETTASAETEGIGSDPVVTEAETTEINAENILGPRDFGGETLIFYSRKYNGAWSSDLIVKEEDGTIVNNAIYRRNAKLSALYNCNFEQIESGMRDCLNDFVNVLSAGDSKVGAAYLGLSDAATAAQRGYLLDMTQLENINLKGEWWTQSLNKTWSIGGAQYFATGVITTIDDQAIRTMFFNKDMIEEHKLKTIYDLVDDNEWVYEKFFEYCEIVKKDDGDGQVGLTDTFGACAQGFGFVMTMGSGEMLVGKDADDYPIIAATENATRFIDVVTYLTGKISGNTALYEGEGTTVRGLFGNKQSLFYAEVLAEAQTMRSGYEVNFGIIPMPKYNAEQENYYQYSTGRNTTVICFPHTANGDTLDMSTFLVEAMAIESITTVKPAYYDVCLKGRYVDDAESAYMLDIVTNYVATDFAEIFGWGGFHSTVQTAITAGSPIASILKRNAASAEKVMNKAIEDFRKIQ